MKLNKLRFVRDTPVLMASTSNNFTLRNTIPAYAMAALPLVTPVPIQDVQLFDYAVAHKSVNASYGLQANNDDTYIIDKDPYTSDQQRSRDQYEINDNDWNEVAIEEVNGSSTCKLALHQNWIEKNNYSVDAIVNMNLPEQGISGPFKITSIKHIIPQKKPVDEDPNDEWEYRPVTGLFTHHSDQVHNITFVNANGHWHETLGVTAPHPIFSTTHNDWRLAGELEVGEKVLTYHGEATVLSNKKKAGSVTVYNLEVKDLHNFLVGDVGVVVHNGCLKEYFQLFFGKLTKKKVSGKKWVDYAEESGLAKTDLHEWDQLDDLGENLGERMVHLDKDKNGVAFPGIDAITENGVPVSLKNVTSDKVSTLGDNIKAIGERATTANGTEAFGGVMKDITGMVTAKKFTVQEIKDKITSVRSLHPENSAIVKKYFVQGKDGSGWIEF